MGQGSLRVSGRQELRSLLAACGLDLQVAAQFAEEPGAHIAQPWIEIAAVQVDRHCGYSAVLLGAGQLEAQRIKEQRREAMAGGDQEEVVLDRPRLGPRLVAAPNGHEDYLGPAKRKPLRRIGALNVSADYHLHLAEIGIERRELKFGRDAILEFFARDVELPVLAEITNLRPPFSVTCQA